MLGMRKAIFFLDKNGTNEAAFSKKNHQAELSKEKKGDESEEKEKQKKPSIALINAKYRQKAPQTPFAVISDGPSSIL